MAVIRDVTQNLIECLLLDAWPRPAAIVDFGIKTQEHLGALQYALKHGGRTPQDFDEALGDGEALSMLCAVPGQPYIVAFATDWDDLGEEDEDEREDGGDGGDPGPDGLD